MYEELAGWLRRISVIPTYCGAVDDCEKCEARDACAEFTNQNIIENAGKAADAIEELSKSRWIPVEERLPSKGESALVYRMGDNRVNPKMRVDVCPYLGDGIFCLLGVTRWMPIPEPPEEK